MQLEKDGRSESWFWSPHELNNWKKNLVELHVYKANIQWINPTVRSFHIFFNTNDKSTHGIQTSVVFLILKRMNGSGCKNGPQNSKMTFFSLGFFIFYFASISKSMMYQHLKSDLLTNFCLLKKMNNLDLELEAQMGEISEKNWWPLNDCPSYIVAPPF